MESFSKVSMSGIDMPDSHLLIACGVTEKISASSCCVKFLSLRKATRKAPILILSICTILDFLNPWGTLLLWGECVFDTNYP